MNVSNAKHIFIIPLMGSVGGTMLTRTSEKENHTTLHGDANGLKVLHLNVASVSPINLLVVNCKRVCSQSCLPKSKSNKLKRLSQTRPRGTNRFSCQQWLELGLQLKHHYYHDSGTKKFHDYVPQR